MRLQVTHRTVYQFGRPVRGVVQSHRLTPSQFAGQAVIDWRVSVAGGTIGAAFRDGAGDWVETVTVRGPVEALAVEVEGVVETEDMSGVLRGHRESVRPAAYLRHTRTTEPDAGLRDLAALATEAAGPGRTLDHAHALSAAVADAIAYRPGETHAQTSAAEALSAGAGVCQDHAHALIAAATCCGVPARYVAGYLFSSSEDGAAEASHAWAELHVDGLGWVGFDPSNRCCPDDRYIRLGTGLDASDAAPIRGIAMGAAEEALDVTVAVQQVQQ